MSREERQTEIEYLSDCLKQSQIALCVDYQGLTVAQVSELRRELRKIDASARVVKNTLSRISAKRTLEGRGEKELTHFVDLLKGPTMLIYSAVDPVAPTKVVAEYMKKVEKLKVKGAFVDGTFVDKSGVEALSKMPGKQEVLAQLLRLISTPATNLVRLLQAPGTQVVRVLDAQREKLEKAA